MPDTADTERRSQYRKAIATLEEVRKFMQPNPGEDDHLKFARLGIDDVISDIAGEVRDLTDRIGDESGEEYAVERSMHAFRSAGL